TNQVRRKLAHAVSAFVFCKPILDDDILSLDPAKLAQLLSERVHKDRATGSSACIQVSYAEDFSCLLRVNWNAQRNEHSAKRKGGNFSHHIFSLEPVVTRHMTLAPLFI